MSATSNFCNKTERLAKSVEIDIENTLVLVSQWLYIRKEYAKQYFQNEGYEPLHKECNNAINHCNEQIEKLLGL